MRKTIVTAIAAFVMGSIITGVVLVGAQPAPPAGMPPMGSVAPMDRAGQGPGPWAERMRERHGQRAGMMRAFRLVNRAEDRKLTPPDVQKIAEAFLLWNGNHTWKVLNAKPDGDVIGFDFATAEGSVIAHFTMDPKTARIERRG